MWVQRLLVVGLAASLLAGCDDDTVTIAFAPTDGTTWTYESEVSSTTRRVLVNDSPEVTERNSRIVADHTVVERDESGVDVTVDLRRDREAPRTYLVRFGEGAQLSSIERVDGVELGTIGQAGLNDLLAGSIAAPPTTGLSPGDTWEIATEVRLPGNPDPVPVTGRSRLVELGREHGVDAATVETTVALPIAGRTDDERTTFTGSQATQSTVVFDLVDGSVIRSESTATGQVELLIRPPVGVVGSPVEGMLDYSIDTSTQRLSVTRSV